MFYGITTIGNLKKHQSLNGGIPIWGVFCYRRIIMINYTTPVIALTVEDRDLTDKDVYVSLEQVTLEQTYTGNRLQLQTATVGQRTDTNINILLTQEESAAWDFNKSVRVQVNWISAQGIREATNKATIPVMENLLDRVIQYGDQA